MMAVAGPRRYSGNGLTMEQKCAICRKQLAAGGKFCQECAHRKGVCYICGKQILDTKACSNRHNTVTTPNPTS